MVLVAVCSSAAKPGSAKAASSPKPAPGPPAAASRAWLAEDRSFPYAPLIDMLRPFLAQGPLSDRLAALGPLAAELVKLLPELAAQLSIPQSTAPLNSEIEKRHLFEALTGLFSHQAEAGPLLLIVEDLHWSDQASLEFLLYLVRRMARYPMLLLLSYRSAETQTGLVELLAGLDREPIVQEIKLNPLGLGAFKHGSFEQVDDLGADRAVLLPRLAADVLVEVIGYVADVKDGHGKTPKSRDSLIMSGLVA